jgi:pyruvate/2-oxoglutarate dehydrogenase complex dihydrolipoamide dehydrogenase (E3) component
MARYDYDFGIIGGGSGGLSAASVSAQLGARTLLIEKEPNLGGDCLHFGCVPSKTLIRSSRIYHDMQQAQKYGLSVRAEPVDFKQVRGRIRSVIGIIQKHDSVERFCGLGAQVLFGQPEFTDEHTVRLNGTSHTARRWLIATGSSPLVPPLEGLDQVSYITNKEIFYLDELPRRMVVIGGGPIGSEMGQAFARFGTSVTIVDMNDRILFKEDRALTEILLGVMKQEGVDFHLESTVTQVSEKNGEKLVEVKNKNGETTTLHCDTLLVAAGRVPNTGGLGLENIGVEQYRKGIKVDSRLRSTQKTIYGAGDVTGGYLFTHSAGYEGALAVVNAVARIPKKTDYTNLPWCTYTDPELASIGIKEKDAVDRGIEHTVWTEEFRGNDRSLAEGHETGVIKMLLDKKGRPLGVKILGPEAGNLLSEWVALFNTGGKLSSVGSAIHPYPTLSEVNFKVAGKPLAEKFYSEKTRKLLKFFFGLRGAACGTGVADAGAHPPG